MNADLKQKFKRLKITGLPGFDAIMEKYDKIGANMSIKAFYRDFVSPVEESITLRQWEIFMTKYRGTVLSRVEKIMERSKKENLRIAELEQKGLKNVLELANITLDEVMTSPELLSSIPIKDRMGWLFKAMAARDSRIRTEIATRQENREQSFFEKLMDGAQYGGVNPDEVPDAEFAEVNQNQNGDNQEQPILDRLPAGHARSAGGA